MTGKSTPRLAPPSLAAANPQVGLPTGDRRLLRGGIVHLGIGAFARAHLAACNEAATAHDGDLRFGIVGVSMRSAATRDALAPQAGLYTLALRDADADGRARQRVSIIGNLIALMVAPENPGAVVSRIADVDTRIVSLTVTEKGYCRDPANGGLQMAHPDIAHDLAEPDRPRSAVGMIVRGLQQRHRLGRGPLTLMSLDNLASNGSLLRQLVGDFARRVDVDMAAWIDAQCSFPNSMVDRIVPRTTPADRASISDDVGLEDAWPVVAEPYFEWAVEDRFCAGRPAWEAGGARLVESVACHERLKLRMVNASHSALAYLAAIAGVATVDAAMRLPHMRRYLQCLMRDEIAPTLDDIPGIDPAAFQAQLMTRFANAALAHQTHQIAMDGSQKIPQRWLGTVADRLARGQPMPLLALAIAAWLRYLAGSDEAGLAYAIHDPAAHALALQRQRGEALAAGASNKLACERTRVATMLQFVPVFGDLGQVPALVEAVAEQALSLRERGVLGTLATLP